MSSVELQEIGADMVCPRCGTDYSGYRVTLPTLTDAQKYNIRTRKLISNGAAHRDRLVRASLRARSDA